MNDTDFRARNIHDIVKVRNCYYSNDINEKRIFYICPCTYEDFFPICISCVETCHKDHNPIQKMVENYTCMCGKMGHKKEKFILSKIENLKIECLFEKFNKFTKSAGYYKTNDKTLCSICYQFCYNKTFNNLNENLKNEKELQCECEFHPIGNVINMNLDFDKHYFQLHYHNFNFNILSKISITKEKYFDLLYKKIISYDLQESGNILECNSLKFFTNMFVYKILELFHNFNHKLINPYFTIKSNFIEEKYYSTAINLLNKIEQIRKINSIRDIITYCNCKIFYAEFIFNIFIKKFICDNIIKINSQTFTNLNLFHRFLFVHKSKEYFKYFKNEDYKINNKTNMINFILEYSHSILDLYERLLRYDEINKIENFLENIFLTFNKIFKELIKYNLITDDIRIKYFELVQDTIQFRTEGKLKESPLFIIKSVFYSLIYYNDLILLEEIRKKESPFEKEISTFKKFVFTHNKISNIFSSVFSIIINKMERISLQKDPNYLKKILKFDFYVKKIFEILICNDDINTKQNFIQNSIENLLYYHKNDLIFTNLNLFMKSCEEVSHHEIIKNYFNSNHMMTQLLLKLNYIGDSLSKISNDFFEYEISYKNYIIKGNKILNDFTEFLKNYLDYFILFEKSYLTENYNHFDKFGKIQYIQDAFKYSNFIISFSKFIFIYGENKKFVNRLENDFNKFDDNDCENYIENDYLKTCLIFLFFCFNQNYHNLSLFMNLNSELFYFTFIQIEDLFFKFLYYLMDMIFTIREYKYDNYLFYVRLIICINKYSIKINENVDSNNLLKNIKIFSNILKLSTQPLKFVSFFNQELITLLDSIKTSLFLFKNNEYFIELISNYFRIDSIKTDNKIITEFLKNYFDFINITIKTDLLYLGVINESDHLIFNQQQMIQIILNNFYNDDIFLKSKFIENYLNLYFNFNLVNSDSQTDDIIKLLYSTYGKSNDDKFYFNDRNISIVHLTDFEIVRKSEKLLSKADSKIKSKFCKPIHESKTKYYKYFDELNNDKFNLIKNNIQEFNFFIEQIIKSDLEVIYKILEIYKYFNNLIINPLFILIDHYLILEDDIKGKESYKIYELVNLFLKISLDFYENNSIQEIIESSEDEKINILLEMENINVILKMNNLNLIELQEDIMAILDCIKYFEIDKIISIFSKNINIILDVKNRGRIANMSRCSSKVLNRTKSNMSYNNMSYNCSAKNDSKLSKDSKNSKNEKFSIKIKNVLKDYSESFMKTSNIKLSLIKIINILDSQNQIRHEIIKYLEQRASDRINYNNYHNYIHYKSDDFDSLLEQDNIPNLETFYTIRILNSLLYHDSQGFQSTFNKQIIQDYKGYERFLTIIIKRAIFTNIIQEMKLLSEISLDNYNNLAFEMTITSMNFLYHLTENKNTQIQQILYRIKIIKIKEQIKIEVKDKKEISQILDQNLGGILKKSESLIEGDVYYLLEGELSKLSATRKLSASEEPIQTQKTFERSKSGINLNLFKPKLTLENEKEKLFKDLENKKYCFVNFLFLKMKLIVKNFPIDEKSLILYNRNVKNYEKLLIIYNSLFNMIIQMIQGVKPSHIELIYKRIPDIVTDESMIENSEYYFFLKFANDVKNIIFSEATDFSMLTIKTSFFVILNNLIAQDLDKESSLILLCMTLFPMDELLNIISRYLRVLYVRFILNCEYYSDEFKICFEDLELDSNCLRKLIRIFRENIEFSLDPFFIISSQIYLFISILSEKYHFVKAKNIREMAKLSIIIDEEILDKDLNKCKYNFNSQNIQNIQNMQNMKIVQNKNKFCNIKNKLHSRRFIPKITKTKNPINNLIITSQFFISIIRSCEFIFECNDKKNIKNEKNEKNENNLNDDIKSVFFIVDPRTYLVSRNTIDKFFNDVNRTSPGTKLKGLIDTLNNFKTEIEYKINKLNNPDFNFKWFEIEYKQVDFINFIISCIIVIILLIHLKEININSENILIENNIISNINDNLITYHYAFIIIYTISVIQIIFNIILLIIFYKSKYEYILIKNKLKLKNHTKKKLNLIQNINLHIIKSFLWTDDTYIITLNIILAMLTFYSRRLTFLYTLQLFNVVKFVDTIKEILTAFRLRFSQFISMIVFLAILINSFAMLGFFFMKDEFGLIIADQNVCQTLISCYLTYFTFGIRTEGGIGNILQRKSINDGTIYWLRYFLDFFFFVAVILLLLNMINGIIISTFSQIRDENEQKLEDIQNKCFICSLPKLEFEKKKINFDDHLKTQHNYYNYLRYLLGLKLKDFKLLDSDETFIVECMNSRKIKFFPIGRSVSLKMESIDVVKEDLLEDVGKDDNDEEFNELQSNLGTSKIN